MTSTYEHFVLDFHNSLIEKNGVGSATDNSLGGQVVRFDAALRYLPNPIDSLMDYGCGPGDFYRYAQERNVAAIQDYTGVDLNPAFINEVRTRFTGGVTALVGNLLNDAFYEQMKLRKRFQCVFASGVFNYPGSSTHARELMRRLWSLCEQVMVLNFLAPTEHNTGEHIEKRMTTYTRDVVAHLGMDFGARFVLDASYRDNDTTLVVYR